ncbi:MAG: Outer membrane protein OprM [Candidatus Celerinatantimonas neptuna]|nr:MAG: Outer membrane protein OprM [Candidatus Celerinatantimonas neptuna]
MIDMRINMISMTLMTILLAGCAVGPDYHRPSVPVTAHYKGTKGWQQAKPMDQVNKGPWWQIYKDPVLSLLLEKVSINNQNVAQYAAQYRKARALAKEAGANLYPTIDLSASGTRSLSSQTTENQYTTSASASWELDLWGKLRRTRQEERASAQASAAELANALLSAQSELAQDYFQLRVTDAKIRLYKKNIDVYRHYLAVVENQYKAGKGTSADVAQARTQLHSTTASMLDLVWQRAQYEHAIAVLMGRSPSNFSLPVKSLNFYLPKIPVGIPSELLQRRPDIAYAERNMASANAAVGVAIAGYYPDVTLSASGGFQNSSWADLFTLPSKMWSIGPSISETLLDFGATKAKVASARANYDAKVAAYRQSVLSAFEEVENNMVELSVLKQEYFARDQAAKAAEESARVTYNQYKSGMISYLDVATTESTSLSQQQSLLSLVETRLVTSVKLVAALGGGWQSSLLPGEKALPISLKPVKSRQ